MCSKIDASDRDRQLPTRLIDVEGSNIRLRLSKDLPSDTEYLTLSHCWGQEHLLPPLERLSTCFCAKFPRIRLQKPSRVPLPSLGNSASVIWIDSLCIFQGDYSDWRAQSALMGNVYGNSTLNIAVTNAPDGDTGCFFKRASSKLQGWKVSACAKKDYERSFWDCMQSNLYSSLHQDSVLAKRGWVFQEFVLPPRILYFGSRQIPWECREGSACETFPRVADVGRILSQ